jgi:ribonuclease BN (tRNA processing enzyme)
MDHIGGLGHLLWTIRKLETLLPPERQRMHSKQLHVYVPIKAVWDGLWQMLIHTEGNYQTDFDVLGQTYEQGDIYNQDGFKLSARGNNHLPMLNHRHQSYSFRVQAGEKTLVFSGDVGHVSEMDPLLDDADLVLIETGHHRVDDVCNHLRQHRHAFGRLGFVHHGREILANPLVALKRARNQLGNDTFLAEDGMTVEV